MALLRDVVFKRGPSTWELLKLETEKFNLKALTRVTIRFDPFCDNVQHIRTVASLLHKETVFSKNQKCLIKTEILTDRSEQTLTAEAINGQTFLFKCGHLNSLEIFQLLNKYVTPLAPAEDLTATITSVKSSSRKKK